MATASSIVGKVIMITGVGAGLGRALCLAFIQEGAFVAGLARDPNGLAETKRLANSERFFDFLADVTSFGQVKATVDAVIAKCGRVDILFNNAALYPRQSFLEETPDAWSSTIDTNVNGVANCCKAVLPPMIASGYGRIVNVGSFADVAPIPKSAAYAASKGAVRALTKAIAADVSPLELDIEIHEWLPGHLKTRMSDFTGIDPSIAAGWAVQLASQEHARRKNCIYAMDQEWLPPKGIRRKIKEALFFWRDFD